MAMTVKLGHGLFLRRACVSAVSLGFAHTVAAVILATTSF